MSRTIAAHTNKTDACCLCPQVIIDEMSMVGRRALGQIDEMLKQAKGSDDWFGGLSISALL